jgi:hypothetical protein
MKVLESPQGLVVATGLRAELRERLPEPVMNVARAARDAGAQMTSPLRPLPDFLIIGAQKSGTTSLYDYMTQHPRVLTARRKELHFFDVHYERGERFYRSLFRPSIGIAAPRLRGSCVRGEASPYYLYHPLIPARVASMLPSVKLIVLLRDPIARALSNYYHAVALGFEPLPLAEALESEPERISGLEGRIAADRGFRVRGSNHGHYSYLTRGRYAEQLERWFAHFPREQFLILDADQFFEDPRAGTCAALEFVGLDGDIEGDFRPRNARSYRDMDPGLRARLEEYYEEPNRRLVQLLGRGFSWTRS